LPKLVTIETDALADPVIRDSMFLEESTDRALLVGAGDRDLYDNFG
jgi:hypothetical protein